MIQSAQIKGHSTNKVIVDPRSEECGEVKFVTVGTQGAFTFWRVDQESGELQNKEIDVNEDLKNTDFVSACFTQNIPQPYATSLIMIGTSDGSLVAYNPKDHVFVDYGNKKTLMEG